MIQTSLLSSGQKRLVLEAGERYLFGVSVDPPSGSRFEVVPNNITWSGAYGLVVDVEEASPEGDYQYLARVYFYEPEGPQHLIQEDRTFALWDGLVVVAEGMFLHVEQGA